MHGPIARVRTVAAAVPLVVLLALASAASARSSVASSSVASSSVASVAGPSAGKIKHIIVIYQENRSFDEVLGAFCIQHHRCNGSNGPVKLKDGSVVKVTKSPDVVSPDTPHGIQTQLAAIDGGKMDGWGNLASMCKSPGQNLCLTYYTPSQVPAVTAYASKYALSDRTFSMYDSPSWGGHIYPIAATQDGFTGDTPNNVDVFAGGWGCDTQGSAYWISPQGVGSWQPTCVPAPKGFLDPVKYPNRGASGPTKVPNVPTILDRLDAKHLSWRVYGTTKIWLFCPQFAECLYGPQHNNVVPTSQLLTDAKNDTLPSYAVVTPIGPTGNTSQHAPASMLLGDNWIAQMVNAVQKSKDWSSTAIFITYDDCGCFYDHVAPGKNPDGSQQGIRMPMLIISPYAKVAGTDSTPATFASILKFAEETYGLAPLGVNDKKAYDYAKAFDFTKPGTAPRVFPPQQPIPAAEQRLLASMPMDDDDPT